MRKVYAYQTSDGALYVQHSDAKRHAQKQYDDHMTSLRHSLVQSVNSHAQAQRALAWIEQNFDLIAEAARLKCDADLIEDQTEPEGF